MELKHSQGKLVGQWDGGPQTAFGSLATPTGRPPKWYRERRYAFHTPIRGSRGHASREFCESRSRFPSTSKTSGSGRASILAS